MGGYYFLASALPAMPAVLGDKPVLPLHDFSLLVQRNIEPRDAPLLKAFLMMIDVSNFEAIHQDRDIFVEGGTLTREEIEQKRNLPLFFRKFLEEKERGVRRPYVFDVLWERYYEYVYSLGQELECRFLTDYVTWDISLRNELVRLRTKDDARDADDRLLVSHVGGHDLSALLVQVRNQKNPLLAERMLDEERLKHIVHCQGSDSFAVDALLASLERARIYDRWGKMSSPFDIEVMFKGGGFVKHYG